MRELGEVGGVPEAEERVETRAEEKEAGVEVEVEKAGRVVKVGAREEVGRRGRFGEGEAAAGGAETGEKT